MDIGYGIIPFRVTGGLGKPFRMSEGYRSTDVSDSTWDVRFRVRVWVRSRFGFEFGLRSGLGTYWELGQG